ncbi:Aspartate-semialdehyde dehydrogenase 2 [bacterium HR28]|uniref:Aspartate-semialdehyde dehydrogenase n=1 Tax=Thermomicrobium roseum TaxID=500 RepID=A0A7C1X4W6_THERO|nr:Aspartate-semialdehyde dehydrogenase 2 [bacterium HR28]
MAERIDVAILAATGSVGQRFVQLLAGHPWFRIAELVASDRSAGKRYAEAVNWRISAAPPEEVRDLVVKHIEEPIQSPIVFSALPGGVAGEIEEALAAEGKKVFTNARDHRMDPDVPLLIPEVNPDHARAIERQRQLRGWRDGFIVANPNCSTIHLVLALKPIYDAFGIEKGIVTTLQAASGAGYPGVPSLDLIDNVVPFISGEEEKIEAESRKILGTWADGAFQDAPLTLSAHCNRVPVRDGHMETVSLKLSRPATPSEIAEVLRSFRARPQELELPSAPRQPIVVLDQPDRPQPVLDRDAERGMASVVGRIRPCSVFDVRFVVLGHNTIRGAAGASVLNAELFYREGWL